MKQLYFLVLLVWLVGVESLLAQNTAGKVQDRADTLHTDSGHVAEKLILENKQQALIDSAMRQQLVVELRNSVGNVARTRELQTQLEKIIIRDSLRRAEQMLRIEALKRIATGYPVILDNDTLFFLYTKIGSFGAQERAAAVTKRIYKLYSDYVFNQDSLRLIGTEEGYDIVYKSDMAIMSINELDALWFNTTNDSLARSYFTRIRAVIVEKRSENSLKSWMKRLGLMALILGGIVLLIYIINKLFARSAYFIRRNKDKFARGLTFRKIRLFSAGKLEQAALSVNNIARIVMIILAVYLSLLLLSGIFSVTERWTETLLGWILTPARAAFHGIIDFLPNLFTIVVIYFIFRYAIRGVKYFSSEVGKGYIELKGFHREWAHPTYNIIRFLMYAFMVILIFPYLPGSDSSAFKGVSVFLGVLFSLGSSSAITNMVAGMVITYMRPFKIGDRVKIGEITGDVVEKNMLVTRIRTIKNEDITVPNSTVLSSNTINYSANTGPQDKGVILHTTVTIGYDVPWKDMHGALLKAAGRTGHVLSDPSPFVLQTSLDDFYVSYQLNVYTKEANMQAVIYSDLHQHIQDCCNESGIEIMSPHYRAMRDGNMTTVPADYLPEDYVAPPFVVKPEGRGRASGQRDVNG